MHISELDTPAILIDLDVMEANLARVANYAREHGLRLRPHTKTHKIPDLGRKQMELGAAGLTVAKSTEAEVMLQASPGELLIAYPVVGGAKLERVARVAAENDVTVAIDSIEAARGLSEAATAAGVRIGFLAEFDAGLHRVGVNAGVELRELVRAAASLPGLDFRGITFYPGHIKDMRDDSADAAVRTLSDTVRNAAVEVERDGFEVKIVSGGSTPILFQSHKVARLNEIRPGTYIFNDRNTWMTGGCELSDCAASILTTVVSTAVPGQMILDGGSKTFSSDRCAAPDAPGFGYFPDAPQAVLTRMNEEHGFVDVRETGRNWKVGERVRVVPNHICVAMNLHEQVYGVRGDRVETVWRVEARGKLQ